MIEGGMEEARLAVVKHRSVAAKVFLRLTFGTEKPRITLDSSLLTNPSKIKPISGRAEDLWGGIAVNSR